MDINFEYYKIFYIIAKNKNITKAAEELNISQPAISRMLKTMEEQLNTKLFIRKTKGVILTQEGNELYRLIADNIDNIMKAENDFAKIINNNTLKIASDKSYLNYLLINKKLDHILKNNTNITFIDTNNFSLLNNQLSNNLIDFAFVLDSNNYQFNDEIKFKKLEELHLIFVSNSKEDNSNKPIVLLNNSKFKEIADNYLKNADINLLNIIKVDNYDNIYPLVCSGYANGFLFKEFIYDELKNNTIYDISTSENIYSVNVGILYNINNEIKIQKYFDI